MKTEKSELLKLLEKMPTDFDNPKYDDWARDVKVAMNEALRLYEAEEYIDNQLEEIRQEIEDLERQLRRHKHLPSGEAVETL